MLNLKSYTFFNIARPAYFLLLTTRLACEAFLKASMTDLLSTSLQSRSFTRRMQSFTLSLPSSRLPLPMDEM